MATHILLRVAQIGSILRRKVLSYPLGLVPVLSIQMTSPGERIWGRTSA
jgi:hypothetical protein